MKVVVTGGAGFIGANLCRALADERTIDEIVVLDDLSSGSPSNLEGVRATLTVGSISDVDLLDSVLQGASTVVHLAARPSVPRSLVDPVRSHEVNASGTVNVLEAVRRCGKPHLIVASSSSVYGENPTLPKHEDLPTAPRSPYAASKLATESYSLSWAESFQLDVIAFRFFNVFGPLQAANHAYAAVVPSFVSSALAGMPITIYGDGDQTRDFTFVGSVTNVITDAIVRRVTCSRPVNLAFGGRMSLLALVGILEELLGRSLDRTHEAPRTGDVRDSQADDTRLRTLFPAIEPVDVRSGLEQTVAWFSSAR
jgi:UDP-glucose 4-epimerase